MATGGNMKGPGNPPDDPDPGNSRIPEPGNSQDMSSNRVEPGGNTGNNRKREVDSEFQDQFKQRMKRRRLDKLATDAQNSNKTDNLATEQVPKLNQMPSDILKVNPSRPGLATAVKWQLKSKEISMKSNRAGNKELKVGNRQKLKIADKANQNPKFNTLEAWLTSEEDIRKK